MDNLTTKHFPGSEATDPQQITGQKRDISALETSAPGVSSINSGRDVLGTSKENKGEEGEAKRPKLGVDDTTSLEKETTNMEGRQCFVTVGATAGFRPLLSEVLKPEFLNCLVDHNFNLLQVQCGEDLEWFDAQVKLLDPSPVRIERFAFTENMTNHYVRSRGEISVRLPGVVVAHAGMRLPLFIIS